MINSKNTSFHGLYDTLELIGSGKFATVKRCVHRTTGIERAAKFIRKRSSTGRMGQTLEDIYREIELLNEIQHKNIVKLYDVFDSGNEMILVLELVKGGELFDLIAEKEVLCESEAIYFIKQILCAVKHLHDRHIVHLDLKPENILLNDRNENQIKLIDFGISRKISHQLEVKGLYGTPEFVAPEIINYEALSTGTDMWAIGCIAYILLSGVSPFLGDTKQDTFSNVSAVDYNFDDQYFSHISDSAKDFISKLLVKNPKKRFTINQCLNHQWIKECEILEIFDYKQKFVPKHNYIYKTKWKSAIRSVIICNKLLEKFLNNLNQNNCKPNSPEHESHSYNFEEDENFVSAALFGAVEDGNLNALQELFLMSNIDPNQCNRHGESLLHYSSGLGYLEILEFLHKKGADINLTDDRGDTIVHWAARQNQPSIIRYFYDNVANINLTNKNMETPLHVAARYGHVETIEQLCKCGANVNASDEHGETAMLIAVWHGFPKIVHILGEVGADTDIKNKEGETAVHVASARGHIECVRCLLEAGARTDVRNKNNYTPLHLSLKRQHVGVASLLLRAGADFEAVDDHGERAIHYASRSNLLYICQTLCSSGCKVNVPNKSGLYPLHLAAKNGHIEIVRCLCLAGSVVDQKNRDSIIPQICAIAQNHNEIAELLTRLRNEQTKEEYISQLVPSCQPIQRFKLKIFGHSGSGKTTLIESLKCGYFSSWFRRSSKSLNNSQPKKSELSQMNPSEPSTPTSTQLDSPHNFVNYSQNSTLGIDCQQVTISGVGDLSIWEFSGNETYFQIYDHFIGNNNSLHSVVFRLSDPFEVQIHSIMFWLYFLQSRTPVVEPLTYSGKSSKPLKVIIIATHADVVNVTNDQIQCNLKSIMQTVNNKFKHIFDINEHIFVMDASAVGSSAMKQLKQYLNSIKSLILQGITHSTGFLESVMTFLNICRKASAAFPVLSWNQFKEIIRSQINPLASDEHFREIILQLQTMGEVLYLRARTENSQDLIILSPRWLTVDIISHFLSHDYICKSRIIGVYSIDDIQSEIPETDALDLLQVLESIGLCVPCDHEGDIAYEFPCFALKEPSEDIWQRNPITHSDSIYCGLRIQCEKHVPSGQILLSIFSRLQISLRLTIRAHPEYESCEIFNWFKGTKLTVGPIEALITSNPIIEAIEVKVRGPKQIRTELFLFMEDVLNIIDGTLNEICPGFVFEKTYLSPQELSQHKENMCYYSSYSILKALLSSDDSGVEQKIKSNDSSLDEKISDIICFGIDDLNSIRRTSKFLSMPSFNSLMNSPVMSTQFSPSEGGPTLVSNLHSSNLLLLTKQRLCAALDPPEPFGRDWCMLGILLGMTDKLPKLDPGLHKLSPTSRLIDECVRESNSTIKVLVEKLKELARNDAIDVILQTGPLFRIFPSSSQPEECLPYNDESGVISSGVSSGSHASSSNLSR